MTENLKFETFYTKNILLNEGNHAWIAAQDLAHYFVHDVMSIADKEIWVFLYPFINDIA